MVESCPHTKGRLDNQEVGKTGENKASLQGKTKTKKMNKSHFYKKSGGQRKRMAKTGKPLELKTETKTK